MKEPTPFIPRNLDKRIAAAVKSFWQTRKGQIIRQQQLGTHDQGNRGAVTGGKQLDGFILLIKDILLLNGVPEKCIFINSNLELPGFYRPNKKWDLLVVGQKRLVAAIEFKSQVGPSFGNNFNNRTEEAMGSALDIWTAYREGVFGTQKAPWLGYFLVLEDCERSNEPVSIRSPHFPVQKEFLDTSYKQRYEIFCNKLLLERQYNAACFLTTRFLSRKASYNCPNDNLSCFSFIQSLSHEVSWHFKNEKMG